MAKTWGYLRPVGLTEKEHSSRTQSKSRRQAQIHLVTLRCLEQHKHKHHSRPDTGTQLSTAYRTPTSHNPKTEEDTSTAYGGHNEQQRMTQHETRAMRRHGDYLLHPEIAGGGEARRRRKKGDDDDSHGGAEPWRRSSGPGVTCATTIDAKTDRLRLVLRAAPPAPVKQKPRPQRGAAVFWRRGARARAGERAGGGERSSAARPSGRMPARALGRRRDAGSRRLWRLETWGWGVQAVAVAGAGAEEGRPAGFGPWGRRGKGNQGLSGCCLCALLTSDSEPANRRNPSPWLENEIRIVRCGGVLLL